MNRDNQAGKVSVLGWIAGFVDGEGYIGLWKSKIKNKYTYVPVMSISNTHHESISYLSEQLKILNIGNHIYIRNVENPKWRQRMVLEIRGMKRIKSLIEAIKPFSITKKSQLELLEEYINKRMEKSMNQPYGKYEEDVFEKLKLLKHE
mgnify:CR=1 FL=1